MTKIGIFRCKENEQKCPLTNCFLSLQEKKQGFAHYEEVKLYGVFTLSDKLEDNINLAKIFKSKGVEVIHFVTCSFSSKDENSNWELGNGFFEDIDSMAQEIAENTGLACVKGTAHLPKDYVLETFKPNLLDTSQ